MSADDLFKLYAVRWNIEIGFRAWKQSGHLAQALARRSNQFHLQVWMLAGIPKATTSGGGRLLVIRNL
jgi:IS4 transposase